eukprot:COSAG02_NODE_5596_length_4200_cov_4.631553_5_plen_61_part_00
MATARVFRIYAIMQALLRPMPYILREMACGDELIIQLMHNYTLAFFTRANTRPKRMVCGN